MTLAATPLHACLVVTSAHLDVTEVLLRRRWHLRQSQLWFLLPGCACRSAEQRQQAPQPRCAPAVACCQPPDYPLHAL